MADAEFADASPTPPEDVAAADEGGAPAPRGSSMWPYVLPLLVYMLIGTLEPPPPPSEEEVVAAPDPSLATEHPAESHDLPYEYYPSIYATKIGLTLFTMLTVGIWAYIRFPFRISPLAILVGVVGVALWIGLCQLRLESRILGPLGFEMFQDLGERPAFNPFVELADDPTWAKQFLAIRFLGLALVVPIMEEFFLRGFLVRFVVEPDWWTVPLNYASRLALAVPTVYGMLTHPVELLAALVWFSLVTWLIVRTNNIWDCVVAHATTNLLLGLYVVYFGQWQLW